MIGVYLYLTTTTFRNRLRAQARRLKNPRYAVALIVGLVYLYFFLLRPNRSGGRSGQVGLGALFASEPAQQVLAFLFLLLAMSWWLTGKDKSALAFSPAEVEFLFPAPVTRRGLLHFKLLRSQTAILLNTLIWMLVFGRAGSGPGAWSRALSFWALFSIMSLHRLGATLVRTGAAEHGWFAARRNLVALTLYGALFVGAAWSFAPIFPALARAPGFSAAIDLIAGRLHDPVPRAVLFAPQLVLAPLFAVGLEAWARAFGPVLLILALHYVWVIRTETSFEESAVEASVARAKRIAAVRARSAGRAATASPRRMRWSIRLSPRGHPAMAIVWKNTLGLMRTTSIAPFLSFVVAIGIMAVVMSSSGGRPPRFIAFLSLMLVFMIAIMGARLVRNDLRYDMQMLGVFKTLPLRGHTVMVAEIISPVLALTAMQTVLLVVAYVSFLGSDTVSPFGDEMPIGVGARTLILVCAPLALMAINAVTVTVQNAAALLFPAWIRLGPAPALGGIETMGQNLLTVAASIILLLLSLIVPAALGGATAFLLGPLLGAWVIVPAAFVGAGVLLGEVFVTLAGLGRVYDRAEPLVAA
jgi:hypothetical protein